jgi:hypothetical protein
MNQEADGECHLAVERLKAIAKIQNSNKSAP